MHLLGRYNKPALHRCISYPILDDKPLDGTVFSHNFPGTKHVSHHYFVPMSTIEIVSIFRYHYCNKSWYHVG